MYAIIMYLKCGAEELFDPTRYLFTTTVSRAIKSQFKNFCVVNKKYVNALITTYTYNWFIRRAVHILFILTYASIKFKHNTQNMNYTQRNDLVLVFINSCSRILLLVLNSYNILTSHSNCYKYAWNYTDAGDEMIFRFYFVCAKTYIKSLSQS